MYKSASAFEGQRVCLRPHTCAVSNTHPHTHTPRLTDAPLCQVSKLEDGFGLISPVLSGHVSGRDQPYGGEKTCYFLSLSLSSKFGGFSFYKILQRTTFCFCCFSFGPNRRSKTEKFFL